MAFLSPRSVPTKESQASSRSGTHSGGQVLDAKTLELLGSFDGLWGCGDRIFEIGTISEN